MNRKPTAQIAHLVFCRHTKIHPPKNQKSNFFACPQLSIFENLYEENYRYTN